MSIIETLEEKLPIAEQKMQEYPDYVRTQLDSELYEMEILASESFVFSQDIEQLGYQVERLTELEKLCGLLSFEEYEQRIVNLREDMQNTVTKVETKFQARQKELDNAKLEFKTNAEIVRSSHAKTPDQDKIKQLVDIYLSYTNSLSKCTTWKQDKNLADDIGELVQISNTALNSLFKSIGKYVSNTHKVISAGINEINSKKNKQIKMGHVYRYNALLTMSNKYSEITNILDQIPITKCFEQKKAEKITELGNKVKTLGEALSDYHTYVINGLETEVLAATEYADAKKEWHHEVKKCTDTLTRLQEIRAIYLIHSMDPADVVEMKNMKDQADVVEMMNMKIITSIDELEKAYKSRKNSLDTDNNFLNDSNGTFDNLFKTEDLNNIRTELAKIMDIHTSHDEWLGDNDLNKYISKIKKRCDRLSNKVQKYINDKINVLLLGIQAEEENISKGTAETIDDDEKLWASIVMLETSLVDFERYKPFLRDEPYKAEVLKIQTIKKAGLDKRTEYAQLFAKRSAALPKELEQLQARINSLNAWGIGTKHEALCEDVDIILSHQAKYKIWNTNRALAALLKPNMETVASMLTIAGEKEDLLYNALATRYTQLDAASKEQHTTYQSVIALNKKKHDYEIPMRLSKGWSKRNFASSDISDKVAALILHSEKVYGVIESISEQYDNQRKKNNAALHLLAGRFMNYGKKSMKAKLSSVTGESMKSTNDQFLGSLSEWQKLKPKRADNGLKDGFAVLDIEVNKALINYKGMFILFKKHFVQKRDTIQGKVETLEKSLLKSAIACMKGEGRKTKVDQVNYCNRMISYIDSIMKTYTPIGGNQNAGK